VASKLGASRSRAADLPDPLEVLNGIIGKKTADKPAEASAEKPVQLVEAIDFEDLSLEEFVARGKESNRILNSEVGAQTIRQCRSPERALRRIP
jgi:hypothetical protein